MAGNIRELVAITSNNTGVAGSCNLPILTGQSQSYDIDVDAMNNQFYVDFTASPPDPFTQFAFTFSSFINVYCNCASAGVEIRIDESIDGSGTTPTLRRAFTMVVSPNVLAKVDGYRVNQSFARVSFANTSAGTVFLTEFGIKVVTL